MGLLATESTRVACSGWMQTRVRRRMRRAAESHLATEKEETRCLHSDLVEVARDSLSRSCSHRGACSSNSLGRHLVGGKLQQERVLSVPEFSCCLPILTPLHPRIPSFKHPRLHHLEILTIAPRFVRRAEETRHSEIRNTPRFGEGNRLIRRDWRTRPERSPAPSERAGIIRRSETAPSWELLRRLREGAGARPRTQIREKEL